MKKTLSKALFLAGIMFLMVFCTGAADYTFDGVANTNFYGSTSYEDIYNIRYNYHGTNVIDYMLPELPYSVFSTAQTDVMRKTLLPYLDQSLSSAASGMSYGSMEYGVGNFHGATSYAPDNMSITTPAPNLPSDLPLTDIPVSVQIPTITPPAFTEYADSFCLSNGAVGHISIPAIGISRYYVWEGETSENMNRGVAHFSSTSVWDGNVGVCGHNRGARYVIGDIERLTAGDTITYTTTQGTRTYSVQTVTTIPNNDWSYLTSTSDNRLTLITCVKNDAEHRWCVQAVEIG